MANIYVKTYKYYSRCACMIIQLKYCCLWNSKLYSSYKTMNDLVTMQKHNDNRYVWVVVTRFCGNNNVSVNDDVSTDAWINYCNFWNEAWFHTKKFCATKLKWPWCFKYYCVQSLMEFSFMYNFVGISIPHTDVVYVCNSIDVM